MIRLRDVGFLVAGLALGLGFVARVQAAPPVIVPAPRAAPSDALPPPPMPGAPINVPAGPGGTYEPPRGCPEALTVTRLTDNTLVSVKDHGDSQTVLVYTFDDRGNLKPAPQKMRFFYKF